MNRRAFHRPGLLAALLLLSTLAVSLGHALRHDEARSNMPPGASVEAWCDFCHQPFVALTQDVPVPAAAFFSAPLQVAQLPVPPPVWQPLPQPRGPPAAV